MRPSVLVVLAAFLAVAIACSSSTPVARPATIDGFVKSFVAAINGRDVIASRGLWHSKSLACITPDSADFYDRAFKVSSRHPIPLDYKSTSKPVGPGDDLGFQGYAVFPVRPTQEVHLDYSKGAENSGTVIFWLVQEGNGWAEVFPCATPDTLQKFKAKLPEIRSNEEKTKSLVDALQDPLRGELVAMLQQGKSASAASRYAQATGQDRTTAMYVVEEIEYRLESQATHK